MATNEPADSTKVKLGVSVNMKAAVWAVSLPRTFLERFAEDRRRVTLHYSREEMRLIFGQIGAKPYGNWATSWVQIGPTYANFLPNHPNHPVTDIEGGIFDAESQTLRFPTPDWVRERQHKLVDVSMRYDEEDQFSQGGNDMQHQTDQGGAATEIITAAGAAEAAAADEQEPVVLEEAQQTQASREPFTPVRYDDPEFRLGVTQKNNVTEPIWSLAVPVAFLKRFPPSRRTVKLALKDKSFILRFVAGGTAVRIPRAGAKAAWGFIGKANSSHIPTTGPFKPVQFLPTLIDPNTLAFDVPNILRRNGRVEGKLLVQPAVIRRGGGRAAEPPKAAQVFDKEAFTDDDVRLLIGEVDHMLSLRPDIRLEQAVGARKIKILKTTEVEIKT